MDSMPIQKYCKVYGERNSGNNWVITMICHNVANPKEYNQHNFNYQHRLGWIHGMPVDKYYARENKGTFFLFLVRNPFAWVLSTYRNPHNTYQEKPESLRVFLDLPFDGYANPIQMLMVKWRAYLDFVEFLPRKSRIIRYEDFLQDPEGTLHSIPLQWQTTYKPINEKIRSSGRGTGRTYNKRKYNLSREFMRAIDPVSKEKIKSKLNKNICDAVGYKI